MAGIKETKDLVLAVTALSEAALAASEDGKIGLGDLKFAPAVVQAFNEAVKGFSEVGAEMKDMDAMEAKELLAEMVDALLLLVKAYRQIQAGLV